MTLSLDLFIQMAYALGIGVLIGLERSMGTKRLAKPGIGGKEGTEKKASDGSEDREYMGIRTFTILSLVGFVGALISDRFAIAAPLTLGSISLLVIAMYFRAPQFGVA